jgi:hypothetical protein
MQRIRPMTTTRGLRILWIRSWVQPTQPLRDALADIGYRAMFTRVDIEPALHAAIARRDFEIAILDGNCGLPRELVQARLREERIFAPLLDHEAPATLVRRIEKAMLQRRS